jgi:HSP20 family protein
VQVELAGMKKEDFDISLQDDMLTISGERKSESEKREGESFRSERSFGAFSRSITLPSPVKAEEVKATYEDGVLTVTLPKAEEAKPKKIQVNLN